jgi:probable HAF family extracellular repeat protein
MQDLGTLTGYPLSTIANGINDSGQVVGDAENSSYLDHAFLYSSGTMQDLNNLIRGNSGWTLEEASGINDSGQICGYGINPSGQTDAFLLTPTPEPSTFVLLAVGALGLVGYGLRRRGAKTILRLLFAVALLTSAVTAQADVFNMPSGDTSLQFVSVGDPGNVADTTGYGSVGYTYQMGAYDVTNNQYAAFLSAAATGSDPAVRPAPTAPMTWAAMYFSGMTLTLMSAVRRVVCVAGRSSTTRTPWPRPTASPSIRRTRSSPSVSAWQVA